MASRFADTLSPRDRVALRRGAVASLVIVLMAVTLPTLRTWQARELRIDARRTELVRWHGVAAAESTLALAVDARTARMSRVAQRPLGAPNEALVAAALQSQLQRYADESQLTVSELDVAGVPDSVATTLPALPATLVAVGDIHGVADLLARIQGGATLLELRELTVQVNPARRSLGGGELLQVTLRVASPYVIE